MRKIKRNAKKIWENLFVLSDKTSCPSERDFAVLSKTTQKGEGGWAIMSAMIAIFVGLIMLSGIFAIVNLAMQGSKVQNAQSNISTIRMSVRQLYAGQPSFSGLDTNTATDAGLVPEPMTTAGAGAGTGTVKNAWDGDVTIQAAGTPTQFEIIYDSVPEEPCVKLAKFGYGSWEEVTVDGTTISQAGSGAVSEAVSACSPDSTITYTSN